MPRGLSVLEAATTREIQAGGQCFRPFQRAEVSCTESRNDCTIRR